MTDVYSVVGLDDRVIQVSDDNIITYANSAFCSSVEMPREEVIGSHLERFDHFEFGEGILQDLVEQEREGDQAEPVDHESSYVESESGETQHVRLSAHTNAEGVQILIEDRSDQYQMEQAFQRYVGPKMLEQIKDADPDVFDIPERRPVTALFSDLRNFTSVSRELKPDEVRDVLNVHFDTMIPIINDHQGMIDKLMGDGIMALFGAPLRMKDHTIRAVNCALEMMRTQKKLMKEWSSADIEMPPCGIGIQTGEAIVGDVGSSKQRDFTAVGPPINLAARMCGAAKPNQILTTEQVVEGIRNQADETGYSLNLEENGQVEDPDSKEEYGGKTGDVESSPKKGQKLVGSQFSFLHLDQIQVKGFDEAIQLISVQEGEEFDEAEEIETGFTSEVTEEEDSEDAIRVFDEYELLEKLGRGGMGVVYRARHQKLGRIVALKMLLGGEEADEQQVKRFQQETRASAMLNHPHIISIHEFGKAEGYPYFTMDYIDGETLSSVIDYHGGVEYRSNRSSLLSSWVGGFRTVFPEDLSSVSIADRTRGLFSDLRENFSSILDDIREDWSENGWYNFLIDLTKKPYQLAEAMFFTTAKWLHDVRKQLQSYDSFSSFLNDLWEKLVFPITFLAQWIDQYTPEDSDEVARDWMRVVREKLESACRKSLNAGSWLWENGTDYEQLRNGTRNLVRRLNDTYWDTKDRIRQAWSGKQWYEPPIEFTETAYEKTKSFLVASVRYVRGPESDHSLPGTLVQLDQDHSNLRRIDFSSSTVPRMDRPDSTDESQIQTLEDVMSGSGLSIEERVRICSKVLDALGYAHDKDLVHRDIKPGNIMIDEQGEPVLMDFGLAHVAKDDFKSLTQSGALIGTTAYMAPEQARGETDEVDERTDVYAMGAVLYELLAGRPAFEPTGNQFQDLEAIAKESPPSLQDINPSIPDELVLIVQKAMNKEKDRRYASALAFKEDLRRFLDNEPITARPPSLMYSTKKTIMRNPAISATIAASLVLLMGLATYAFFRINRQKNRALEQRQKAMKQRRKAMKNMRLAQYQSHLLQGNKYFAKGQWSRAFQQFSKADQQKKGWQSQLRLGQIVNKSWPVLVQTSTSNEIADGMILSDGGDGRILLVSGAGQFSMIGEDGEEVDSQNVGSVPNRLRLTADGNFIVAGFPGASFYVLRRSNLETVATKNLSGQAEDLSIGPDGKLTVLTEDGGSHSAHVFDLPLLKNHEDHSIKDPGKNADISYTVEGTIQTTGSERTVVWNKGSMWNLVSSPTKTKNNSCSNCVSENRIYFDGKWRVEVTWKNPPKSSDPALKIERDPPVRISTPRKEWYGRNHWLTDSQLNNVHDLDFTRRNDQSWLVTLQGESGIEIWELDRSPQRLLHSGIGNLMPHRDVEPSVLDSTAGFPRLLVTSDTAASLMAIPEDGEKETYRKLPGQYSHHATTANALIGLDNDDLVERRFDKRVINQYDYPDSLKDEISEGIRSIETVPGTRKLVLWLTDRIVILNLDEAKTESVTTRVPVSVTKNELESEAVNFDRQLDSDFATSSDFDELVVSRDPFRIFLLNEDGTMHAVSTRSETIPTTRLRPPVEGTVTLKSLDRNNRYTAGLFQGQDRNRLVVWANETLFSNRSDTVFEKEFEDVTQVRLSQGGAKVFVGREGVGTEVWNVKTETKDSVIPEIEIPANVAWNGKLLYGRPADADLSYSVYSIDREKYLLRSPWPASQSAIDGVFSRNAKTVGVRGSDGDIYYLRLRSTEQAQNILTRSTGLPSTDRVRYQINRGKVNINEAGKDELRELSHYQSNIHESVTQVRNDVGGFVDVDELNEAFFKNTSHTRRMRDDVTVGPELINGKFYSEIPYQF